MEAMGFDFLIFAALATSLKIKWHHKIKECVGRWCRGPYLEKSSPLAKKSNKTAGEVLMFSAVF